MKTYDRILRAAYSVPWAIQPEKLEAILAFLAWKTLGKGPTEGVLADIHLQSLEAAMRADGLAATPGSVAVLPLFGLISHRANMMGDISGPRGTSVDQFTQRFRQAVSDPNCKAIVIDVDSPGGTVDGVPELADEIYKARGKKPITAVADCLMASAAYWIGCSASELVCSPSSAVGSIGVYSAHEDKSQMLEAEGVKVTLIAAGKYKTEGNPFEPLGDDARAAMQSMVDDFYGMFLKAVAKGRGAKAEDVQNGFGQGRVVTAAQAVKLGMADRIGTLDSVLAKYGVSRGNGMSAMSTNLPVGEIEGRTFLPAEVVDMAALNTEPVKADEVCSCPCETCKAGNCAACDNECMSPEAMEQAKARTEANRAEGFAIAIRMMRDRIKLASL